MAAWYRLGWCYEKMKDKRAAITAYKTVLDSFPGTSAAFKAKQRLLKLGEEV